MAVAARYVARELALVFAGVFALLLTVGLGGRFVGFLQQAAVGRFSADALWLLLAYRAPEFVQVSAPFALTVATLLTFGRLHAEQEFAGLANAGVGPGRVTAWLLLCAAPVAVAVAALAFFVTPEARRAYAELARDQLVNSGLEAVSPAAFHVSSGGRRVTYAEAVDADSARLTGVFMAEREARRDTLTWAADARQHRSPVTGSRYLELRDGARYQGVAGSADFRVVQFARMGQRLARATLAPSSDPRAQSTGDLNLADARHAAELHWRVALPLMVVVSAIVAVGVARPAVRGGRFARVMPGVGMFLVYYLLLVFAQDALAKRLLPAGVGLWLVHGAMLALGVWLARRSWRPR